MNRDRASHSGELLAMTQQVLDLLRADRSDDEVDPLLERQKDAFSQFSRNCEMDVPLDASTRADIDDVLRLDESIIALIGKRGDEILRSNREIEGRKSQVQAFYSRGEEPPRFITRRV